MGTRRQQRFKPTPVRWIIELQSGWSCDREILWWERTCWNGVRGSDKRVVLYDRKGRPGLISLPASDRDRELQLRQCCFRGR